MTRVDDARWQAAQDAELGFHTSPWAHVGDEVRAGARGLLRIDVANTELHSASVLDVGCGPKSLLLDVASVIRARHCIALDPLDFGPAIEHAYDWLGITRLRTPIEHIEPSSMPEHFDEVWCYNTLQHVLDVELALLRLQQLALRRVRLFEWIDEPTSIVHPHALTLTQLRAPFADSPSWRIERELNGRWRTSDFDQLFYAAMIERVR